jgi:hypothetical protein
MYRQRVLSKPTAGEAIVSGLIVGKAAIVQMMEEVGNIS